MNLVLYTHPEFLASHSHANFAAMLVKAYTARGHSVELRQPKAVVRRLLPDGPWAKWAGYVDQYVLFPWQIGQSLSRDSVDTLYVFCDQALGPWMPYICSRPHVVHCHDLMALRSALGEIPQNPTSFTGRLYQRYIRWGFRHARHFISVSRKSQLDLHRFGAVRALTSEVVYNGLNYPYVRVAGDVARQRLTQAGLPADERGCLLHVGGGQWYKNTSGVLALYDQYARGVLRVAGAPLPLWVVGPPATAQLQQQLAGLPAQACVRFFQRLDTSTLEAAYSHAHALLFPSLAEGFGWPIAEAMACGCPVVTTDEAPMNEVGGDAAIYLPRLSGAAQLAEWSQLGAATLQAALDRDPMEIDRARAAGCEQARRFNADAAIDKYLSIYRRVLASDTEISTAPVLP